MLFFAFFCLRTCVRTLGTVCISSQSFRVIFVLRLFVWILDSLRKVLKNFESLSQPDELVGKPNQPVHRLEQQFGFLLPFMSVLSHSESDLYSVCCVGLLTL